MFPAASAALGVRIDVVAQPAMNWRLYCASLKLVMSRRSPSWESSFTRTRMPYNPGGLPSAEVTRNNIVAETPTASTPMHVVVPLIWWRLSSEVIVTLLLGPIAPVPAPGPPLASSWMVLRLGDVPKTAIGEQPGGWPGDVQVQAVRR